MFWLEDHGLAHNLLDSVLSNVGDATDPTVLWFSEVTGLIVGLHMMLVLSARVSMTFAQDSRRTRKS